MHVSIYEHLRIRGLVSVTDLLTDVVYMEAGSFNGCFFLYIINADTVLGVEH